MELYPRRLSAFIVPTHQDHRVSVLFAKLAPQVWIEHTTSSLTVKRNYLCATGEYMAFLVDFHHCYTDESVTSLPYRMAG